MRSMKAHIWDTGVFFSVLLLLIIINVRVARMEKKLKARAL